MDRGVVMPFAALSVAAAMMLSSRQALLGTAAVWLANQAAGFLVVALSSYRRRVSAPPARFA